MSGQEKRMSRLFRRQEAGGRRPTGLAEASLLLQAYEATRDPTILEPTICSLRAVTEASSNPNDAVTARFLLGQALWARYKTNGNLTDLEWALRHMREAVESAPPDDPRRASRLQQLGTTLLVAVEHLTPGEAPQLVQNHLNYAEELLTESLASADKSRQAVCRSMLGLVSMLRFQHRSDLADLDKAIEVLRRAASEARTPGDVASCQGNLGKCLMIAYQSTRLQWALDEAVSTFRAAFAASPLRSSDHATHRRHLEYALQEARLQPPKPW